MRDKALLSDDMVMIVVVVIVDEYRGVRMIDCEEIIICNLLALLTEPKYSGNETRRADKRVNINYLP